MQRVMPGFQGLEPFWSLRCLMLIVLHAGVSEGSHPPAATSSALVSLGAAAGELWGGGDSFNPGSPPSSWPDRYLFQFPSS